MHLILLVVGALTAIAGMAMIRLAVPIEDLPGAALFISGVVGVVGGLIIAAIAVAVRKLSSMAERLEIQPLPLPPIAAVGREDPAPRPPRAAPPPPPVTVNRFLGWFGRGSAPAKAGAASAPRATPPGVDLAPLAKVPEEPRPPIPAAPPTPPVPPPPPKPATPIRPAAKPPATNGTPESTVYRSGVIDGMAYTLFMDGSIEAELPHGRVKFPSVDELQKYLTTKT